MEFFKDKVAGAILGGSRASPVSIGHIYTPVRLERTSTVSFKKKESALKERKAVFRRCKTELTASIPSDFEMQDLFEAVRTQTCAVQDKTFMSLHEVNTETIDFLSTGMLHLEGGWPKDISVTEEDQKLRHRKKVEKDEGYLQAVIQLGRKVEECIRQNNALDIYELYFQEQDSEDYSVTILEDAEPLKTINVIRDPARSRRRMVTDISFAASNSHKVAVAYSTTIFAGLNDCDDRESYVWDMNTSSNPDVTFRGPSWVQCIQYNPRDINIIGGGLANGEVCMWDTRQSGHKPCCCSPLSVSHSEVVTGLRWIPHKNKYEIFSTSLDGLVCWWDTRKLTRRTDTLILDPARDRMADQSKALSATAFEYEHSMPTKFMVASEQGLVAACNRKIRNPRERIYTVYQAHNSSVYSVQRNPFFMKNFLTVADWSIKLWAEEFNESPILQLKPCSVEVCCSYAKDSLRQVKWNPITGGRIKIT